MQRSTQCPTVPYWYSFQIQEYLFNHAQDCRETHCSSSWSLARSPFAKPCLGYKWARCMACQWNVNSPWLLWSLHLGKEPAWCPSPVFKAHAHARVHQGWAPITQTYMVVIIKHSQSLRQVQRCLNLPRHSPLPGSKRQSQLSFLLRFWQAHQQPAL